MASSDHVDFRSVGCHFGCQFLTFPYGRTYRLGRYACRRRVSVVAGALLGLVPALQSTRPDVAGAIRSENAGGRPPGSAPVAQRAGRPATGDLAAAAGRRRVVPPQPSAGAVGRPGLRPRADRADDLPDAGHPVRVPTRRASYTRRLLDLFRALPGLEAVGAISNLHLNPLSQSSIDFNVDGFVPPTDHGAFIADRVEVEPGFDIGPRGPNFNVADRRDTRPVVIFSEAMAWRFWTDGDTVGPLVRRRDHAPRGSSSASDAKVRTLGESPRSMIHFRYSQRFTPSLTIVAMMSIDPARTALALLTAGRELDPDLRVLETKTIDRHLALMRLPQ